jgi:hypothetical protein
VSDRDPLPTIAASRRTPLVEQLLEQIEELIEANRRQAEQIQQLRAGDRCAEGPEGEAEVQAERDGHQDRAQR